MLCIVNNGPGIGEKLQFACLPENYFRNFGEKVADLNRSWVFDYNPYVTREFKNEEITDVKYLWMIQFPAEDYLVWRASDENPRLAEVLSSSSKTLSFRGCGN